MVDIKKWPGRIGWTLVGATIGATIALPISTIYIGRELKPYIEEFQAQHKEEREALTEMILSQMEFPPLPPPVMQDNSFDYCQISGESDDVDRENAGEDIKPEKLFKGSIKSIDDLVISKGDITNFKQSDPANRYQAVLVGVGYTDDKTLHEDLGNAVNQLSRMYANFNIDFSYLGIKAPITIDRIERSPRLPNEQEAVYWCQS